MDCRCRGEVSNSGGVARTDLQADAKGRHDYGGVRG